MWGSIAARNFSTKRGERKRKIKRYQQILDDNPDNFRVRLKLADLLVQQGEKEKAIEEYLRVAQHFVKEEMDLKAISLYQKILRVDPTFVDAYLALGNLYMKRGLFGDAKLQFQKILEISPNEFTAEAMLRKIEKKEKEKSAASEIK